MSAVRVRTPGNLPYTKLYCDWTDRQGSGCPRNAVPPGGFDARDARKVAKGLGYTRVDGKDYCPDHQCQHGHVPGDHHYESGTCGPGTDVVASKPRPRCGCPMRAHDLHRAYCKHAAER